MTSGSTAYLKVKTDGNKSMPLTRESSEVADDGVPQDPRDTVRATLPEPQSPAMQAYIPRHSGYRRGHGDEATKSSSPELSAPWAVGNDPTQGDGRGTHVALERLTHSGNVGSPTGREPQGDGATVVV
jgi:hypothetical protein